MAKRRLSPLREGAGSLEQYARFALDRNKLFCLRYTLTWACNSRCATCDIWKKEATGADDVHGEVLERFATHPLLSSVRRIVISGGEPTMSPHFVRNIATLHRAIPGAYFSFTINGLHREQTVRRFRELLEAAPGLDIRLVGVSLNGPPAEHDHMRGIERAFERTQETFDELSSFLPTAFSFTLYKENVHQLDWAQQFAASKRADVYICWLVNNDRFCTQGSDLGFSEREVVLRLAEFLGRQQYRSYELGALARVTQGVVSTCRSYQYDSILRQKVMPCYAGRQFIHLAPNGDVYPCNFLLSPERRMGNIRERSLDAIMDGFDARMAREIGDGTCMFRDGELCGDSDIFYSIMNSLPRVFAWYLRRRLARRPLIEAPAAPSPGGAREEIGCAAPGLER